MRRDNVALFAEPDGSICLQITSEKEEVNFRTCSLILPDGLTTTFVIASWSLPGLANMVVGQTPVLSTEKNVTIPTAAEIRTGIPNDLRDFTEENAGALKRRRDTLAGSKAAKKRKLGHREVTIAEIFQELNLAHKQLDDLLASIKGGKTYHIAGLLRLLRFLITDKKDKPLPVLQMCAAIVDMPLNLYAPPISPEKELIPIPGFEAIAFEISSSPSRISKNVVDIDVWLDSRASQLNGRVFSQRELINKVASSVAAHFDLEVMPEADMLRAWKSGLGGINLDFLSRFAVTVASSVRDIIRSILARTPS